MPTVATASPMKDLLRFSTAGSVDDGKSTLIGRLLFDTKGAFEDQLASIKKNGLMDLSLLTDGLRAEREQGITIDVAYRYFSTPRRKFIIADTPGHEQYTRNMATGASTADVTIILIDARKGVLPQSRRHAYIASLLGIPSVAVAVNKMDLVEYREDVFQRIEADFRAFTEKLDLGSGFRDLRFFPISALAGDNVVDESGNTPWYQGGSLLRYLETAPNAVEVDCQPFRLPVQYVIRPTLDFRGYAGQLAAGTLRPGDAAMVLPSRKTTRIASLASFSGDLDEAFAPMSVNVTLEDEIDISRGDILVSPVAPPMVAQRVDASLVWMDSAPLRVGRPYIVKHASSQVRASVAAILYKVDINTLDTVAADELRLNEIAAVTIEAQRPICFDSYGTNRIMGAFILIDAASNATVAAGMIRGVADDSLKHRHITEEDRWRRQGHRSAIVTVEGPWDLAYDLERELFNRGIAVAVTEQPSDAEALRHAGLVAILQTVGPSLGRTPEEICKELEAQGVIPAQSFATGEGI